MIDLDAIKASLSKRRDPNKYAADGLSAEATGEAAIGGEEKPRTFEEILAERGGLEVPLSKTDAFLEYMYGPSRQAGESAKHIAGRAAGALRALAAPQLAMREGAAQAGAEIGAEETTGGKLAKLAKAPFTVFGGQTERFLRVLTEPDAAFAQREAKHDELRRKFDPIGNKLYGAGSKLAGPLGRKVLSWLGEGDEVKGLRDLFEDPANLGPAEVADAGKLFTKIASRLKSKGITVSDDIVKASAKSIADDPESVVNAVRAAGLPEKGKEPGKVISPFIKGPEGKGFPEFPSAEAASAAVRKGEAMPVVSGGLDDIPHQLAGASENTPLDKAVRSIEGARVKAMTPEKYPDLEALGEVMESGKQRELEQFFEKGGKGTIPEVPIRAERIDDITRLRREEGFEAQRAAQMETTIPDVPKPKTDAERLAEQVAGFEKAKQPVRGPSTWEKAKDLLTTAKNYITRTFPELGEGHGALKEGLRRLGHAPSYAADRATREISGILEGMDAPSRSLFNDAVVAADLASDISKGREIPFFDPATFEKFHIEVTDKVRQNKAVQQAIAKRKEALNTIKREYVDAMKAIGRDVEHIVADDDYFRHLVAEHMQASPQIGVGGKLASPTNRGFLKARGGTKKDIVANYAQAEFDVLSKMLRDTESARLIRVVDETENIARAIPAGGEIPEGYVRWNPGGGDKFSSLYRASDLFTEDQLIDGMKQMGMTDDEITRYADRIMQRPTHEMVVPEGVAKTLNKLSDAPPGKLAKAWGKVHGGVKWWLLNNPKNWAKFNIRNLSGDAEAVFVGNPSGFKKSIQAARELYDVTFKGAKPSPMLEEWMRRGGWSSGQVAQELDDIASMAKLGTVPGQQEGALKRILAAPFRAQEKFNNFREAILRYANFLDYAEQIKSGKLKNYGASIRGEVNALTDPLDKAFKLSNELLGAYDQVSAAGRDVRRNLIPFWSWKEVNAKRTWRMMKNAWEDGNLTSALGKKLGAKTLTSAVKVGGLAVKMTALSAIVSAYNKTVMADEDASLPDYIRNQPHITLGRGKNGEVRYLTGISAFGDLLSWVGLDSQIPMVREWLQGRAGIGDVAKNAAQQPVNALIQQVSPLVKEPISAMTGKDFFPDAFNPRNIRDTTQHIFRSIALGEEYSAAAGLPDRSIKDRLTDILYNEIDPGAGDYQRIRDLKENFLKRIGKEYTGAGSAYTDKNNALYYYRQALRYGDDGLAKKYLTKYYALGGKPENVKASLERLSPLDGLSKDYLPAFLNSLDAKQKMMLKNAQTYYGDILMGKRFTEKDVPEDFVPPSGEVPSAPSPSPAKPAGVKPNVEEIKMMLKQRKAK